MKTNKQKCEAAIADRGFVCACCGGTLAAEKVVKERNSDFAIYIATCTQCGAQGAGCAPEVYHLARYAVENGRLPGGMLDKKHPDYEQWVQVQAKRLHPIVSCVLHQSVKRGYMTFKIPLD
jgi:hypothetical protein